MATKPTEHEAEVEALKKQLEDLTAEKETLADKVKAWNEEAREAEVEALKKQLDEARAQRDEAAALLSDAAEGPPGLVGTVTIAGAKCISRTKTESGNNAVFEDNEGRQLEIRHFAPGMIRQGEPYDVTISVQVPQ